MVMSIIMSLFEVYLLLILVWLNDILHMYVLRKPSILYFCILEHRFHSPNCNIRTAVWLQYECRIDMFPTDALP